MRWNKEETKQLQSIHNLILEKSHLLNMFQNKSLTAIRKKAIKIGVNYKIKFHHHNEWSNEDTKKLINNFSLSKYNLKDIFKNRTWNSIVDKIKTLGLKRNLRSKWSKQELEYLTKNYPGETKENLLNILRKRKWGQIVIKASKLGISREYLSVRKNNVEKLLLETPEAYYWIGFLLADGSFYKNRIKLHLANKDCQSVLNFAKFISATENLHIYESGAEIQAKNNQIVPIICKKFDIKERKTYNPPNIKKIKDTTLLLCLIIGYIDGDGNIYKHSECKSFGIRIQVHSSWIETLRHFCDVISGTSQIKQPYPHINKQGYTSMFISNSEICKKLKSVAISNNLPYMKRKWDIIDDNYVSKVETSKKRISEVCKLIKCGKTIKEISKEMNLKYETVYALTRRNKLFNKL